MGTIEKCKNVKKLKENIFVYVPDLSMQIWEWYQNVLWSVWLKEYSVILTTSSYGINQKI